MHCAKREVVGPVLKVALSIAGGQPVKVPVEWPACVC